MNATIDDALELVTTHFKGLTDEDGEPYVMHCLRVMFGVHGAQAQQVAVMHDLIEDTEVTLDELKQRGFAAAVVQAVGLLTHQAEISYADYIVCLRENELARQVKLSDLRDNTALNRILYRESSGDADSRRIRKYILSSQFLSDRISEADYRRRMTQLESK